MIVVDTDYTVLSEIDPEIVQFYAEETRQRLIGWDEDLEQEIWEPYTVIVRHEPPKVTFDDVSQRRDERKSDDVIRAEITRAIAFEHFHVNHDLYLKWKSAYEDWEVEQPFAEDENGDRYIIDPPARPVIDMENRRAVYFVYVQEFDSNLATESDLPTISFDDDKYIKHIVPTTTPKSTEEISTYHRENAKKLRETMKLANIFVHGHYFQVRQEDRNNMDELIKFAERNSRMDETTDWITADNDSVTLTMHQLLAIKDAYVLRMGELFKQYRTWKSTGMQTPFVFVDKRI